MEINIISLVMAILAIASGGTAEEQAFQQYVLDGEQNNWQPTIEYVNVSCNESEPIPDLVPNGTGGLVVLYSDIQIHGPNQVAKFEAFKEWANTEGFIYGYGLGDQIDDYHKDWQMQDFLSVDSELNFDRKYVTGNHDKDYWAENDMILEIHGETCFYLFNTYSTYKTHGEWTQAQINWLDNMLSQDLCLYDVVLSHHEINHPNQNKQAKNDHMIKEVMENYNNQNLYHIHGHMDWYWYAEENNIHYFSTTGVRQSNQYNNAMALIFDTENGEVQNCWTHKPCEVVY